ncbi:MAG: extracellular solute-binding protein [Lentisphaerae bacterium]|nr:extracellular solute-binding protein [Lentisphaerota bacterium]
MTRSSSTGNHCQVTHVKLFGLPDPSRTDPSTRASVAVVRQFVDEFPRIFAERYRERYEQNPARYGDHDWSNVRVELEKFSGITIEGQGMDSGPLMAIAGGVSPDIIYVNFRQSDTYIREGFLYPLDKPEDGYMSSLTQEELDYRIHPRIWPVIRRNGPGGKEHVWAMPSGGVLGKVALYRRDLLTAAGIPFPSNDWTWDDFYAACKKVTNPEKGIYGTVFGTGSSESWYWVSYLWSAGGEVMSYDADLDEWSAVFSGKGGAIALDFYTRLNTELWYDANGKKRRGYTYRDTDGGRKWDMGQIAFMLSYIDEKMFATINPDVVGMVPVPFGPTGGRGAELNSRMQGLFAGIKSDVVRDAAWEYLRWNDSKEAVRIRTGVLVEGGLGRFVNPRYLREFGYEDIVRFAPKGWEECFNIAMETGKPEPYGRNCQLVYEVMTKPIQDVDQMARDGVFDGMSTEERLGVMSEVLKTGEDKANEMMIGRIAPRERRIRRFAAVGALILIAITFAMVFRRIFRAFAPPETEGVETQAKWGFKKYGMAYLLLLPAVISVFLWQYLPLFMGSTMAFQDYRIMGGSQWVGVDNFGNLLWDMEWWQSVYNALRYSFLVIGLTFLPPVILAVILQEVPRGSLIFRTLFYLPAVVTGLVVIYLWKSFYDPTEFGVLNAIVLGIPGLGYVGLGTLMFLILFFFGRRLYTHHNNLIASLCVIIGVGLFLGCSSFAWPMLAQHLQACTERLAAEGVGSVASFGAYISAFGHGLVATQSDPYRWLQDPSTAMLCCVIPMVWAGMGPGCLIYLAALKGVAPDFYEAADIDGATFLDKVLFIVIPTLKPLLIINFVGVFVGAWKSSGYILAMTGGGGNTEVAGLHIFYKAYMHLKFGPATAMAWVLGFMLIGFTVNQLRILSRLEFKTTGDKK